MNGNLYGNTFNAAVILVQKVFGDGSPTISQNTEKVSFL